MADYANLKSAIQQVIKTNGNEEITGSLLQQSLLSMIDSLGAGYQFMGIATPSTNPGTPDQNVYYIASTAGTYSNFGGITLNSGEVALLTYNGSWTKQSSGFASEEKVNQLGGNVDAVSDSIGGVDLELITFTPNNYIVTNASYIPNSGGEVTMTANNNWRCAAIPCSPNDVFLLNNTGGSSANRAYAWARSDFSVISHSGNGHTCDSETVIAPANAAWLIINDSNTGKNCYKGRSFKYYVDNADKVLKAVIDADIEKISDSLGGVNLTGISFTAGGYINTQNSTIPNSGGVPTITANVNWRCASVQCSPGDTFLLNNSGSSSVNRAYAWAKSDFSVISHSGNNHTCVSETVVAPANAAWLIINDSNTGKNCYKGRSFKDYVDKYVSILENETTEISTITVGANNYNVSSEKASKRLLTDIPLLSGTGALDPNGGSTQNIIAQTNVSVKRGNSLLISLTGLVTYCLYVDLYVNGTRAARISESSFTYVCPVDVTTIRVLAVKASIVSAGNVSASISIQNVYGNIGDVANRISGYSELEQLGMETDVYGNELISPTWRNIELSNNAAFENASTSYITCDFIPVDRIAFLRITCSGSYSVFRFDKNKTRLSTDNYSGNSVISFNSQPKYGVTKYIRIRVYTNNPNDISVSCDTLISRYNNKRLLGNKNVGSFGHRGSPLRNDTSTADNYPSSIWGAYINGFEGVHVNVQFTTDNVPFCLHDDTFVDDVSGATITLSASTSAQIEGCRRDGEPIAKVESAIYMAKMMGLDIILYNIYGGADQAKIDVLVGLVQKYDMFEHAYFGVFTGTLEAYYLQKLASVCPKAKILRTQSDISSTDYSQISALISDAESILQTYPNLQIYLWLYEGHSENNFIQANMNKPYNVHLAAFGVRNEHYGNVLPYVSIYTSNTGVWSFGTVRRDIEKIVTDKYPEFLLGNYGNII